MTEFVLNGKPVGSMAESSTPLAYVLRNELGCKSVRIGCEAEQCGTCTVLADGEPVRSCSLTLGAAAGTELTTLEGLAQNHMLSAVQDALLRFNATQCGFCLSGIAIAAHALFRRNPHPTREEIVATLDAHLCRCGAHPRVLRALEGLAS